MCQVTLPPDPPPQRGDLQAPSLVEINPNFIASIDPNDPTESQAVIAVMLCTRSAFILSERYDPTYEEYKNFIRYNNDRGRIIQL